MSEDAFGQLKQALLRPEVAVAFAWDKDTLNNLILPSAELRFGRLCDLPTRSGRIFHRLEIRRATGLQWPLVLVSGAVQFVRLLDKLYVPTPRDECTTIAVFDACAPAYESLIDLERNLRNIRRLLDLIDRANADADRTLHILDFGCGTGLSIQALARHPNATRYALCGLDAAPHMRMLAEDRGLHLIEYGGDEQPFDAIFASYVLHGGLTLDETKWILQSLNCGGMFVANWLHASDATLSSFVARLEQLRQGRATVVRDEHLWPRDPIVVFYVDDH